VLVAGVDGCRAGWAVALADARDGTVADVVVVPAFAEVVARLGRDVAMIAVDMPIGLPDAGPRACDVDARRLLGARRSTVFPAPPRPMLGCTDYQEALGLKHAIDGIGLSKQAFHLLPKIAEVDAAITPLLQARVVESHPELAFRRLAGSPLDSKHRQPGRAQRISVVQALIGALPIPRLGGAAADDVLDALALTATARALVRGTAERLGDGARDARGLVMEIAH
jgi:predicted RNase H-like nuclease